MTPNVTQHIATSGIKIYSLPVEVFPRFWANVYLLIGDGMVTLIDAGSGLGDSNDHLLAGFERVRDEYGETATIQDLTRIIITHAHIDHFGGLPMLRQHTNAPITMHTLDRRVIINYEGRLMFASKGVGLFLRHAGVSAEEHQQLMQMYLWNKAMFHSLPVEETVEDGDIIDGVLKVIAAPGHCPGQICLQLDDILFSADHILARTSPHLAPETITPSTGLEHYRQALTTIERLDNVRLTLAGHEEPIENIGKRIAALRSSHDRKIERMLGLLREQPRTIAELSKAMYRQVQGYDVLLALEKVGAFAEFLYLRGYIRPTNVDPDDDSAPQALIYEVM